MIRAVVCVLLLGGAVSLGGAACAGGSEAEGVGTPPRAASAPVVPAHHPRADPAAATTGVAANTPAAIAPKLPASKRLLGRWEMNLNDAPKEALAKDFQRYKQSKELADMVHVEYTVTDTDWVLRKYGAGGVYEEKWKYQVLQENGDVLVLERVGEDGEGQRVELKVGEDTLVILTSGGLAPLRRMKD